MRGKFAHKFSGGSADVRVALLIETSREFGRGLLRGIMAYAMRQGRWGLHVMPGDLTQALPTMRTWHGTGIIARVTTRRMEHAIRASGLPFIGVALTQPQIAPGQPLAGAMNLNTVAESVVKVAIEHLLERGLRQFAFVGEVSGTEWSRLREMAAARVLAEHGISCRLYPRPPAAKREWGRESHHLAQWLRLLPHPMGIIAPTDLRGRQVIEACREVGLRVPQDAAVIGVDNDLLLCNLCDPPLSSVALDVERAGWEAAALLDQMMHGQRVPSQTIVINATHVVPRLSTATAQASDPRVAAAREYIIQHARRLIQVRDVVEHVGLSRRTLELRFRAATGRSLLAEIRHVRLEHVAMLLRETNLPVCEIAADSGFTSSNYLSKVFRRVYSVSPEAFRAQTLFLSSKRSHP